TGKDANGRKHARAGALSPPAFFQPAPPSCASDGSVEATTGRGCTPDMLFTLPLGPGVPNDGRADGSARADRRKRRPQRIEQRAVTGGAPAVCLQRLPDLRRTGGAYAAARVLEPQAGCVERQPAGIEQCPGRSFRVALKGFVRLQVDVAGIAPAK